MSDCPHDEFDGVIEVYALRDTKRWMVEVTVHCVACKVPLQFLGLPLGLNMDGASCDPDATTARLATAPKGSIPHPLAALGVTGFTVKGSTKLDS